MIVLLPTCVLYNIRWQDYSQSLIVLFSRTGVPESISKLSMKRMNIKYNKLHAWSSQTEQNFASRKNGDRNRIHRLENLTTLLSVSCELVLNLALAPS